MKKLIILFVLALKCFCFANPFNEIANVILDDASDKKWLIIEIENPMIDDIYQCIKDSKKDITIVPLNITDISKSKKYEKIYYDFLSKVILEKDSKKLFYALISPKNYVNYCFETNKEQFVKDFCSFSCHNIFINKKLVPLAFQGVIKPYFPSQINTELLKESKQKIADFSNFVFEILMANKSNDNIYFARTVYLYIYCSLEYNLLGYSHYLLSDLIEAHNCFKRSNSIIPNICSVLNMASIAKREKIETDYEYVKECMKKLSLETNIEKTFAKVITCGQILFPEDYVNSGWNWIVFGAFDKKDLFLNENNKNISAEDREQINYFIGVMNIAYFTTDIDYYEVLSIDKNDTQSTDYYSHVDKIFNYFAFHNMPVIPANALFELSYKSDIFKNNSRLLKYAYEYFYNIREFEKLKEIISCIKNNVDSKEKAFILLKDYIIKGRPGFALTLLEDIKDKNYLDTIVLDKLIQSYTYFINNDIEKGTISLYESFKLDNNLDFIYDNLLVYLMSINEKDKAFEVADTIIQKYPIYYIACRILGVIYSNKKDYDNSLKYYYTALHINPEDLAAVNDYSYLLTNLGQATLAEKILSPHLPQIIDIKEAGIYDTYAYALLKQGKLEEAKNHYLKIIELRDNLETEICLHIALLYCELDDYSNTKKYFEKISAREDLLSFIESEDYKKIEKYLKEKE